MSPRWDVPDAQALRRALADAQQHAGRAFAVGPAHTTYFRDVYFDTADADLHRRGARYRKRFLTDGRVETDATPQWNALTDESRLAPWLELGVDRTQRTVTLAALRLPVCAVIADSVVARRGERSATLFELSLASRVPGLGPVAARRIARGLATLRPAGDDPVQRALAALESAEAQQLARELRGEREIALVTVQHGRLGLCRAEQGTALRLPIENGSGEASCRAALRRLLGSGEGQLRLLGIVPPSGDRVPIEVWAARRLHSNSGPAPAALQWFSPAELVARVGSPILRDAGTLAALTVAARSPLLPEWSGAPFGDAPAGDSAPDSVARSSRVTLSEMRTPLFPSDATDPARAAPEQFLNPELSWVEFNARVLALAESSDVPLAARVRFLGIFSTNLDQFVMTQVGALKQVIASGRNTPQADGGGLRPQEALDAIAIRLRPLIAEQYRLYGALLASSVVAWNDLTGAEQAALRTYCTDAVLPFLSPKALTRAPGHPFPHVADRRITLLLTLRDRAGAPPYYALVELPPSEIAPRFVPAGDGRSGRMLALEDLVRANLDLLYPGRLVAGAHAFRLTRSGDLQLDEAATANFLQAIEEELVRRQHRPVVRIEIEAGTPSALQDLLQRELRIEESERESTLTPADVYAAPGPVDLGALRDTALPASLPDYPPLEPREPFDAGRKIFDQLDERDHLVYHPFDSFPGSFERFIAEAADDPDVQAIKLTLYRPGGPSTIADALRRAAAAGKDVSVIVELKARFDEARNIAWAKDLEREGIHVVTGLVSLKTHAKLALVVRRGPRGRARRYAHVGSGNYNPDTARAYTDVGLFTADGRVTADVHALFNELTGSTQTPRGGFPHLLVAPADLLARLLALIERETAHARAGRPARIRAKLNGLADSAVIQALYAAAQAGVDVDLIVRGICTLRPGVPGLSERIRVVSILGRFLEHARIYHFTNAGADEFYIGSADWRPRNLRRRVEIVVPVFDAAARARLDGILTRELADPGAWMLQADGSYERLVGVR